MALQSKRVHFSESPVMYTYSPPSTPRTPSPSWSEGSLPDHDSGPSTPPSTSSFPSRALPSTHESAKQRVVASPVIFDERSQLTPLIWDVSSPPTYAAARTGRKEKGKDVSTLLPSDLASPATLPAKSSMDIFFAQIPPFWKPIQLRRDSSPRSSHSRPAPPITVGEVLDAVHRFIHTAVSQMEFSMFPKNMQDAIAKSYWKRHDYAMHSGNVREAAAIKKDGMSRLDVLAGNTKFVALVPASKDGDVWTVVLARP